MRRRPDLSRRRRERFLRRAAAHSPLVGAQVGGLVCIVDTADEAIERKLFVAGEYVDARVLRTAATHLGDVAGSAFVDVGANIGSTTLLALDELGFGSAVAIEPEERNHRLLRANLELNGLASRAVALRAAVSDAQGEAELALRKRHSNHRLLERPHPKFKTARVQVTTLDALVAAGTVDPATVGLLWIDVEGHELRVLRGAGALLDAGVPVVAEFSPGHVSAEDRAAFQALVADRFARIVDLRAAIRGDAGAGPRPAVTVAEVGERYTSGGHEHTDLLLLPR